MGKTAYFFTGQGQGSVSPQMGYLAWQHSPKAREVFAGANLFLRRSLSDLCFFGPPDQLLLTINAQPASLVVNLAWLASMSDLEVEDEVLGFVLKESAPDYLAGHSVGYIAALVCAGVITSNQALAIVQERGRLMTLVCQKLAKEGNPGKMVALIAVRSLEKVEEICRRNIVGIGCYNSESEVVVSGRTSGVDAAVNEILKLRMAGKAVDLKTEGDFHWKDMDPVAGQLDKFLKTVLVDGHKIVFEDPRIPIVGNSRAQMITTGSVARQEVLDQVAKPVQWAKTEKRLREEGVTTFIEMGHGEVLSNNHKRGLIKAGVAGVAAISFSAAVAAYFLRRLSEQKK